MTMRTLRPQAVTATAFSPDGPFVQAPAGAAGRTINSDPLRGTERHALGSQGCVPLGSKRSVLIERAGTTVDRGLHALATPALLALA